MIRFTMQHAALVAAIGAAGLLAACGEKAPPPAPLPPPPPPPPVAIVIPPRPTPPFGASTTLFVPPVDATGLRYSVNRNITPAQTLWNLRSAYNVAALNCHDPRHTDILTNYKAFLKAHAAGLSKANKTVDAEFRKKYGNGFVVPREKYMTEVYNHYALPPTMSEFCTAVLAMSRDALVVKPVELEAFAARSLPNVEVVFDNFYRRYDEYKVNLADWQAKYAPAPTPVVLPGSSSPAVGTNVSAAAAAAGRPAS
ncbi:hypothetical protein H7F51_00515 [Novosphingobium flavum]|uniref:Uncharacterized protein n=1 Tax=Novosphingobium flavum TaxID=1778672 RepID=A0A7X1FP67_9SPHN|nr:hypothetical protein [Novosphingobium flavum]MBC2663992.1 hypothetical protein [Novosphingobium flavum]